MGIYEVARGLVQGTVCSRGGSSFQAPTGQSRERRIGVSPDPFRGPENPPPSSPVYIDVTFDSITPHSDYGSISHIYHRIEMTTISPDSLVESRKAHVVRVRVVTLSCVPQCIWEWEVERGR
jgi:hypothetical protein